MPDTSGMARTPFAMFTGMILDVGRVTAVQRQSGHMGLHVSTQLDMHNWQRGDSVAVDGCCLTITTFPAANEFAAVLSPETLDCTHFRTVKPEQQVNLEPAMRLGDVLGGHMVSGHVDGTGRLLAMEKAGGGHYTLRVGLPSALQRYVIVKGSIAINGVSLTVNAVDDEGFTVNLIPHTLSHTNLGCLNQGQLVNIETDMIGRYVERLLAYRRSDESS